MVRKFLRYLAPVLLTATVMLGLGTVAAHASTQTEMCAYVYSGGNYTPDSPCMDMYNNGGAYVKSYSPGATWENFYFVPLGGGEYEIQNGYNGHCVGDAGNSPSSAVAVDNAECPTSGNAGWGTIFRFLSDPHCPGAGGDLYNTHWQGDLDGLLSNGSQWYLNTGGPAAGYRCIVDF